MKTQFETPREAGETLTQHEVDETFAAMFTRMEELYRLDHDQAILAPKPYELEAIRDGILGELLEKAPHEAVAEVVQSLAVLYQDRTIESEQDGRRTMQFATRDDKDPSRLDDYYEVTEHPDGTIELSATLLGHPDMGTRVRVSDTHVRTYTKWHSYEIATNPVDKRRDGSLNTHERILREFYLQALSTAGLVLHRRENDPEAAASADRAAYEMLARELGA